MVCAYHIPKPLILPLPAKDDMPILLSSLPEWQYFHDPEVHSTHFVKQPIQNQDSNLKTI